MSRSLILACSATKLHNPKPIPAWHRYDGPAWRTLRANISAANGPIEVFALSAAYGLISTLQIIPDYDERMTEARANALAPRVAEQLREHMGQEHIGADVFFIGGKLYRRLFAGAVAQVGAELELEIPINYASGGIGEQLGQLKAWLRRDQ